MSSDRLSIPPASVTSEQFRWACGRFATGISVATVMDSQGVPHGLTVNSFSSVSLDPPLVSICLGHAVSLIELFRAANYFGINVLDDTQRHLSDHFARKGHDRFEGVAWTTGQTGVPLIYDVLATMECQVERRISVGDHDILIGRLVASEVREGSPLVYFAGGYRKLEL